MKVFVFSYLKKVYRFLQTILIKNKVLNILFTFFVVVFLLFICVKENLKKRSHEKIPLASLH